MWVTIFFGTGSVCSSDLSLKHGDFSSSFSWKVDGTVWNLGRRLERFFISFTPGFNRVIDSILISGTVSTVYLPRGKSETVKTVRQFRLTWVTRLKPGVKETITRGESN